MNESIMLILLLFLQLQAVAGTWTDSVDVARNSIFDPPQEEQVFFYHKDHLGSTLCITDRNGQIVERSEYIPYGEVFIDNLASDAEYETPYKFTGKEYDEETGLYYFGARYLHPKYATWLSVDPLATKYPNVSPYAYCEGNPIKFIDPDGRDKHDWLYKDKRYESLKIAIDHFNDDPKVVNIWAHGNNEGFAKKSWRLNVNTTDAFICELKNTPEFQRTNGKNMTIVLHCCSTAPFAEKLSETDFFKDNNIVIIAPSDNIGVNVTYESQCSTLAEIWYILTGQEVPTETVVTSIVQNNGSWVRYENGKEVKRYASDAEPGSKDFVY